MSELHIPPEVADAIRALRPELRKKLSLRDIDDMTRPFRNRIRELEDELEDVRRDAENNEEQLGYLQDLQTQVNALFTVMDVPGHETLTAADTIDYAVEHLSNEKEQRERIRELEADNKRLRGAAGERWDMIEMPGEMSVRDMHQLAQEGCRFFYLRPALEQKP